MFQTISEFPTKNYTMSMDVVVAFIEIFIDREVILIAAPKGELKSEYLKVSYSSVCVYHFK